MKKQEVFELLTRFPDEVDTDEFMETLYLRAKLDRAEAALANGDTLSHEELIKESQSWFK